MVTRKPTETKEGAPRWTYVAGAAVAVVGLIWGIASHFISKPDLPKPPVAVPGRPVSVSGVGNVGAGEMSGGVISNGVPAAPTAQAGSAPLKAASAP